jgi:hypothetical protein
MRHAGDRDISQKRSERDQGYWAEPAVPYMQVNIMI